MATRLQRQAVASLRADLKVMHKSEIARLLGVTTRSIDHWLTGARWPKKTRAAEIMNRPVPPGIPPKPSERRA